MQTTHNTAHPAGQSHLTNGKHLETPACSRSQHFRNFRHASITSACFAALVLVGAAVSPSRAAVILYDFNDGTLQGWTTISSDPGNTPGPTQFQVNNTYTAQGGSGKSVWVDNNAGRDDVHATLWIRSPEFKIDQDGPLTFWLLSGRGAGLNAGILPTNASQIPTGDSTTTGVMGVALRDTSNGDFVLTGQKSVAAWDTWEQITFDVSALKNNGRIYTLELFDYYGASSKPAYASIGLDTVSIPGTVVVPEPGAALLGGLGLLSMLRRKRAGAPVIK